MRKQVVIYYNSDKYEEIKSFFGLYCTDSFLRKRIKKNIEEDDHKIEERIKNVRLCICHGITYFDLARKSEDHAKALLYYYGILKLSQASIIMFSGKDIAEISASHGLTIFNKNYSTISEIQSGYKDKHFGTFHELMLSVNQELGFACDLPQKISYNLEDIFSRIPEFSYQYYMQFKKKPKLMAINIKKDANNCYIVQEYNIDLELKLSDDEIFSTFPLLKKESDNKYFSDTGFPVQATLTGEKFLVSDIDGIFSIGIYLEYMLLHALSNVVRYRPDVWLKMERGESDEHLYPLIKSLFSLIPYDFLNAFLNHISGIDHIFAISASNIYSRKECK